MFIYNRILHYTRENKEEILAFKGRYCDLFQYGMIQNNGIGQKYYNNNNKIN